MGLFYSTISSFFFGPRIKMQKGILYCRSSLFGSLLTLFAFFKQVWVDPQADTVRSQRRILWIFKLSWQVDFCEIRNIKYECKETTTGWDEYQQEYDTIDRYVVGLNLHDGRYKQIWSFPAAGGFQCDGSLEYVEMLQFFTKKTLGPDHSRLSHQNQDWRPAWAEETKK